MKGPKKPRKDDISAFTRVFDALLPGALWRSKRAVATASCLRQAGCHQKANRQDFLTIMRAIMLALAIAILPHPAHAQTITSIDTELVKGRCRFVADDGEVGHYALKRCPGLAGARVYTEAGVNTVKLSFRWGKRKVEVVDSGSIGTKLEWRGTKSRQGFKPHAVIVTIVVKDYPSEARHNVLGVLRMEPRNACLMAVIDEAANDGALALARKTADSEAQAFSCTNGKAKVVGSATKWTQEAIGSDGNPPK
jgi:hypothetical protein